jgi:hypothetical protein
MSFSILHLKMEIARFSDVLVNIYQITWHQIPGYCVFTKNM